MNYETWKVLNNIGIGVVLLLPIILAIIVFITRRRRRAEDGKPNGRPIGWSIVTLIASFLILVDAWGLALQERYPEFKARYDAEVGSADGSSQPASPDTGINAVNAVVGSWRPSNSNRTDYFTFTTSTYSSVNPEFDTTITYTYRVLRRDGPCMRIEPTGNNVIQSGVITQESSRTGEPFIVCVDPETDQMLMRFPSGRGDVFFTRME